MVGASLMKPISLTVSYDATHRVIHNVQHPIKTTLSSHFSWLGREATLGWVKGLPNKATEWRQEMQTSRNIFHQTGGVNRVKCYYWPDYYYYYYQAEMKIGAPLQVHLRNCTSSITSENFLIA